MMSMALATQRSLHVCFRTSQAQAMSKLRPYRSTKLARVRHVDSDADDEHADDEVSDRASEVEEEEKDS